MTNFENQSGFTLTGSKLQLVELVYKDDQYVLDNIDEVFFDEVINFESDKETKIISTIQSAFNELIIRRPFSSRSVSFSVPLELFYTMQIPYENSLLHHDLISELRWEFTVLYPFLVQKDLVVQYFEVEKNIFLNHPTVIAFAICRKYLNLIHNFCGANNLRLKFVDNVHLASDRALSVSRPEIWHGLSLSIYLGNRHLSVIFTLNGKPVYLKVMPFTDASEIPAALTDEINNNEIISLKEYSVGSAFITGEEISDSLVNTLRELLGVDLVKFNPFENIKAGNEVFENKFFMEKFNGFSSAAGMAIRIG